jgi:hypothetical protein
MTNSFLLEQGFEGVLGLTKRDGLPHNRGGLRNCDGSKNELGRELSSDLIFHREGAKSATERVSEKDAGRDRADC